MGWALQGSHRGHGGGARPAEPALAEGGEPPLEGERGAGKCPVGVKTWEICTMEMCSTLKNIARDRCGLIDPGTFDMLE